MSDSFVPVGAASELKPGKPRTLAVAGREIAIFNVDGAFYAIENSCPHQGSPLDDGWVEGTTITCPWHAWCFRLTDGEMEPGGFARVATFDIKVEDGLLSVSTAPRPRAV